MKEELPSVSYDLLLVTRLTATSTGRILIDTEPVKVPIVQTIDEGHRQYKFQPGNGQNSYIIPMSQWNRKLPYTYSYQEASYGEIYVGVRY